MRTTSVQKAYDAAVDPEGWPTERAKNLLEEPGLAQELYGAAQWLTESHEDLDPVDVFLAAFTTALIWREDNTGVSS